MSHQGCVIIVKMNSFDFDLNFFKKTFLKKWGIQ